MRALTLLFLVSAACAPGPFGVEVHHAGRVDPVKDEAVADKAQDLPWDGEYKVEVVQQTLPEGGPYYYSTGHETVMAGQIRAFVLVDKQAAR